MINPRVVKDLLQKPLGPYRDRDVLHETLCQTHRSTVLVLYSFVLEHNSHVIGLDESEEPLEGRDDRIFRFRGHFKIANPEWLSDFGVKTVETELNLRADERAMKEGERRQPQPVTLKELFVHGLLAHSNNATWGEEDEMRLTLLIQGEKNMPAVYMHADRAPNGLLWSSKAHNREYRVETMDVETYSQSENFFWRWRLIALMQKIVDRYRFVPAKRRTPIWFVDKYLECFGCPLDDKQRRLLFDPDDSDVVDEKGKTNIPRHLLKPHTSEILGIFASQVEWLVSNHVVRRKKLFDLTSWMEFAKEVQAKRKEAARHGVKWGWPVGKEVEEESSEDDEGAGIDIDELVRNNPVIGKSNKVVARKIQLARAKLDCGARMSVSSGSGSEGDAPGGAEYVSDFSEPSDVEENDSDHRPAEEEAVNQIPWELRLAPLLPDVDGRWWCPLQGCNYQIDLHDLTEEKRRGVPGDLVEHILRKQWRNAAYDEKVLQGFRYMVTNHYVKHFEERGIKMEGREGMTRCKFINDRQKRQRGGLAIRGPMPVRGTLGGESRVVPTVHAPQAAYPQ